jgi:hypothetical protein
MLEQPAQPEIVEQIIIALWNYSFDHAFRVINVAIECCGGFHGQVRHDGGLQ